MKHLRFDYMGAHYAGDTRPAQKAMKELGINYETSIPQSMGDQWWFFNCSWEGDLPSYITEMTADAWMVNNYKLPENYVNK